MRDRIAVGVDLGGTKTEAVVLRAGSPPEELLRRRIATERERGYDAIVARTAALVADVAREAGVDPGAVPLGVGMPGGTTRREGLVKNSNTVCLNGRPFRADLQRALGRPAVFDNDANCFALAEACMGAGVPHRAGVGGGVVLHGRAWPGLQGIAGEWGHHPVRQGPGARPCYCGHAGCLEAYASGPAVEADYARRAGVARPLAEVAARVADDPHAAAAMDEFLDAFGRGLATVIDVLDPSAVVLGGGVSHVAALYTAGVARARAYVFNDELVTPVLPNALGDSAGVLGAAMLALT